jgi:hypothetical protein
MLDASGEVFLDNIPPGKVAQELTTTVRFASSIRDLLRLLSTWGAPG